jgi:hypothetical protein
MRGFLKFAWLPLMALPLVAAPINVSTGINSGWQVYQSSVTVTGLPESGTNGTGFDNGLGINSAPASAVVLNPLVTTNYVALNVWAQPADGAQWIAQRADDFDYRNEASYGAAPGVYTYTLNLGSVVAGSLSNFRFASDDAVTVRILNNGTQIYNSGQRMGFGLYTEATTINFAAGTLVIEATVKNGLVLDNGQSRSIRNASGLLVMGTTQDAASGVPEPSTYAMLGIGGAGLLIARMRRGK